MIGFLPKKANLYRQIMKRVYYFKKYCFINEEKGNETNITPLSYEYIARQDTYRESVKAIVLKLTESNIFRQ